MPLAALPLNRSADHVTHVPDKATFEARTRLLQWVLLPAVLALGAAFTWWHLRRGLIPHDDGAVGQAAERVLRGELPHRDFDDIYTGGLAYLNAWGFRLLGASFWTMRIVLFAAFLAWVPAVYYIATRILRPVAAAALTLLAIAWSIPSYPAPMPSWYNLFLATIGIAALFRGLEDPRSRWVVLAGVAGGLSILMKVVGLYYVAGVLLFLIFQSHAECRAGLGSNAVRGPLYAAVVTAALLAFVVALVGLIHRGFAPAETVHFAMPGALLAATLAHHEWTQPAGPSRERFTSLARLVGPFVVGIGIPIVCFLVPYVRSGAVGDLVFGVFVLPTRRFSMASLPLMPLSTMVALLPVLAIVGGAHRWPTIASRVLPALIVFAALGIMLVSGHNDVAYRWTWFSARNLVPVLVIASVFLVTRPQTAEATDSREAHVPRRSAQLMLLTSVTALCSLIQFPFAAAVYFCYVAPLVVLLAAAVLRELRPMPAVIPGTLLVFYLTFAVVRIDNSSLYAMGYHFAPYPHTAPLRIVKAGVDVLRPHAEEYEGVIALLQQHARGGYTWASADCPEIYFLSGLRNPTRSLFDFFDDPVRHRDRVLTSLDAHGVTAIVLNRAPDFSPGITVRMYNELARRYPNSADVGRFHVRWR